MSMYLDGPRPFTLKRGGDHRKHYSGEIIGPYELVKLAGEGPNAAWNFWKARCLVCDLILTINTRQVSNLIKHKSCKHCRGKKPEAPSVPGTEGASIQPTE